MIYKIKLGQFINWVTGKETPPDNFNDILIDYAEALKSSEYIAHSDMVEKLVKTKAKYISILMAIKVLAVRYSPDMVKLLQDYGYNYKFDLNDPIQFINDLNMVVKKSKTLLVELEQLRVDLERTNREPATESEWIDGIAVISKYMGFRIDRDVVTLGEYASYQRQYTKYVHDQENKQITANE